MDADADANVCNNPDSNPYLYISYQDYQQEFSKTSARVNARREREELLRGGSPPPSASAGLSRRDQYAKEANHLHRYVLYLI